MLYMICFRWWSPRNSDER